MHLILAEPFGMHLEMATEDYLCSLLLSRCRHALLATGNGLMMSSSGQQFIVVVLKLHLKRIQNPRPRKLERIILTNFLLPRAFQRIIMLAGAAACRSL